MADSDLGYTRSPSLPTRSISSPITANGYYVVTQRLFLQSAAYERIVDGACRANGSRRRQWRLRLSMLRDDDPYFRHQAYGASNYWVDVGFTAFDRPKQRARNYLGQWQHCHGEHCREYHGRHNGGGKRSGCRTNSRLQHRAAGSRKWRRRRRRTVPYRSADRRPHLHQRAELRGAKPMPITTMSTK